MNIRVRGSKIKDTQKVESRVEFIKHSIRDPFIHIRIIMWSLIFPRCKSFPAHFHFNICSISDNMQILIFSELQFNYNPFHSKFYLRCFPDSTSCITNHFLVLAQILTHHSYIPHPYEIRLSSIPRCDKIKFIWVQG